MIDREKKQGSVLFLLLAIIVLWLKTIMVAIFGFNFQLYSLIDVLLILLSPIGSIMLIMSFSFFMKERLHKGMFFLALTLTTGLLYGDLLYYRFYSDFVTVPILFQFKNVGGLGPSTFELMSAWDLLLFADLIIIGWMVWKKNFSIAVSKVFKTRYFWSMAAIILLSFTLSIWKTPHLFSTSYDRENMVKSIGLFHYHGFDIATAVGAPFKRALASETDAVAAMNYSESFEKDQSALSGIAKGKNLVLISMESTQNFVINQRVNGEEITPFLNDLIKDSIYFDSVYDQTAQGKTSDAEFMVDTSLYPLPSGSVFVRKPDNIFHSLPYLLKTKGGYYNTIFHGNDASFWNREQMYDSLGYDRYFSKTDYNVTEENSVNYGIKDIYFFQQTVPLLEELPQPFYSRLITLTNHFPFLLDEEDQYIAEAETNEGVVNRYIQTVRYQDEALKQFFDRMQKAGLYENTIFVLYGDHYGISAKYEGGLYELLDMEPNVVNHVELQKIPVIIHIPGEEGKRISTIGGEIDIRPTILNLLGIQDNEAPSFGHNLLIREPDHPVIFRDGSFVSQQYIFKDNICYQKENGTEAEIEACAPYIDTVREELQLSDEVITGDLLRFLEE